MTNLIFSGHGCSGSAEPGLDHRSRRVPINRRWMSGSAKQGIGMAKVPGAHFDTSELPPAERFRRWSSAVPTWDVSPAPGTDPGEFYANMDAWFLGALVLSAGRMSPLQFIRSPEKIKADGADQFIFLMLRRGSWSGDVDGRMITAGPGQIVVFDLTRPNDTFGTATESVSLRIARAPVVAAAPIDLHGFTFQGPIGRVLADHMMMMLRRLPVMEDTEVATTVNATLSLIASCVSSVQVTADDTPARELVARHRVLRYVDDNLGARDLTAATIGRQLGMPRSVIYRAFEPLGGIAQHVRARRLEPVHVLLENPDVDGKIADIAGDFGFASDVHFSRTFRERYGYNPRRTRNGRANGWRELAAAVGTHAGPDVYRAWLKQIR
jgi:AraC-like DNA-binding protein